MRHSARHLRRDAARRHRASRLSRGSDRFGAGSRRRALQSRGVAARPRACAVGSAWPGATVRDVHGGHRPPEERRRHHPRIRDASPGAARHVPARDRMQRQRSRPDSSREPRAIVRFARAKLRADRIRLRRRPGRPVPLLRTVRLSFPVRRIRLACARGDGMWRADHCSRCVQPAGDRRPPRCAVPDRSRRARGRGNGARTRGCRLQTFVARAWPRAREVFFLAARRRSRG